MKLIHIEDHAHTANYAQVIYNYLAGPRYMHLQDKPTGCEFIARQCFEHSQHIALRLASSIAMLS